MEVNFGFGDFTSILALLFTLIISNALGVCTALEKLLNILSVSLFFLVSSLASFAFGDVTFWGVTKLAVLFDSFF